MKPNRILLALAGPCLLAASLHAQTLTAAPVAQNIVQLSASGSQELPQDWLSITLNTSREGPDAAAVQAQLKTALEAALAQAKPQVLAGQMELRTGNFSLFPRNSRDGRISGWQGSVELVLEGRDIARISGLAARLSTLSMGNVSFSLSREQRLKAEAEVQQQAIERFKAKAAEIARSFGFAGYTLREVAVSAADQASYPRPRLMAMDARAASAEASPVPVEAGKSTVMVTVSGSVQLR